MINDPLSPEIDSKSSPQAAMLVPMAISLGWGILFATTITLVLIPVFMLVYDDVKSFSLSCMISNRIFLKRMKLYRQLRQPHQPIQMQRNCQKCCVKYGGFNEDSMEATYL